MDVRTLAADVLPGIDGRKDPDDIAVCIRLLDDDDGVGAGRHRCTGGNLGAYARLDSPDRYLPGEDPFDAAQRARIAAARARRILGTDGVTIHRGARKRRDVQRRDHVPREHPAVGPGQRDAFAALDHPDTRVDDLPRFSERTRVPDRPHLRRHHLLNC